MKGCIPTPGLLEARLPLRSPGRGRRGRVGRRKAGETVAPGPAVTHAGPWGGHAGRGRRGVRGSYTRPAAQGQGNPPGGQGPAPTAPPATPYALSVKALRPAELTASTARRSWPPSCTTTAFLLFPPAPPHAVTSATAPPVTLARRPQRPAWPHPAPRPASLASEQEAAADKLSARAGARRGRTPT